MGICIESGCGYAENDTCNACINKTAQTCDELEGCVVKDGVCSTCTGQEQQDCVNIKGCTYNTYQKCHYDLCNYQDNAYECLERFCGFNTELSQCQTCESQEQGSCSVHYGCYWQDNKCKSCHHLNKDSCLKANGCKLVEGRCLQDSCPLLYDPEDEGNYEACLDKYCGIDETQEQPSCTYCSKYSQHECAHTLGCGWDRQADLCISCNKLNLQTGSIKGCIYSTAQKKYVFDKCANYQYVDCFNEDCGWNFHSFCATCYGNQDCPAEFCVHTKDFCFGCTDLDVHECALQPKNCVVRGQSCESLAKFCNTSCQ